MAAVTEEAFQTGLLLPARKDSCLFVLSVRIVCGLQLGVRLGDDLAQRTRVT